MSELPFDHRAADGVADARLRALLEEHWEAALRRHPLWAGRMGDRRYDDRLPGSSPAHHEAERAERRRFLARAREIDAGSLAPGDALNLRLLLGELEREEAVGAHRTEEWTVLPRGNPVTTLGWLPEVRAAESRESADALLARYAAFPEHVDGAIETLRLGAASGRVANAESLRRTVAMVGAELARPAAEWAAVALVAEPFRSEALAAVEEGARPAIERYGEFLERELLPRGREGDRVGLSSLEGGEAAYAALIRRYTTLERSAEEIRETGLAELARIREEFAALGESALGTAEIPEIFERLRTDPALRFSTAEEVETKAADALDAARAAIPGWFGRLPRADCVVRRVPDHEAPWTTVAYYRPGSDDGARPGEYRINVHAPETRPRHEALALAFHESIPGHHLQISIAQELRGIPAFRRHGGVTAYVEGWALYTERLAEEMGLYEADLDRLGMLSFDAWRAARLVVDTGIHAFGWTRERAVRFMLEETPLAANNIDNEVDRYVSWPGQALSYKIGQIEMWRLRRRAEAALGAAFDVRAFHDRVLGAGPLPLGVLSDRIEAWTAERRGEGE